MSYRIETIKLLIIDDDESLHDLIRKRLAPFNYEFSSAYTGESGISILGKEPFDVVLLDYLLTDMNGITALEAIKNIQGDIPVLMFTAHPSVRLAVETIKTGGIDLIEKPVTDFQLLDYQIRLSVERSRREQAEKKYSTDWLNKHILGAISHELRRPIKAIIQEADDLRQSSLSEEQQEIMARMAVHLNALTEVVTLIENQSEITRINS